MKEMSIFDARASNPFGLEALKTSVRKLELLFEFKTKFIVFFKSGQ